MLGVFIIALLLCFAPQILCLSTDEDSFTLQYKGGKIMTEPVTVSLLWFGDGWKERAREALRNAIASLTPSRYPHENSEVPTLGNWWQIVQQYTDGSNIPVTDMVDVGKECFYTGPHLNMTLEQVIRVCQSMFNRSLIDGFGGDLSCKQVFKVNDNTIYHIMFSDTVKFLDGQAELIDLCYGNFEVEVSKGVAIKMVWARAPQKADDQCSWMFNGDYYLGPPNGDEKIDSLVGYTLANIAEEVSNRDGKGWSTSDGTGLSVSSLCASLLERGVGDVPLFKDVQRNVSFNVVGLKGYRYMVQHVWDQKIKNCALKLSEPCGTDTIILKQPKGYLSAGITVNHTDGLQPYPPNLKCKWKIQYPTAKFIAFTLNYLSTTADGDDHLRICKSDSIPLGCSNIQSSSGNFNKNLKFTGSRAYVQFNSGNYVSTKSRGWELSYSAGFCNGKEDVYDHYGVIGYTPPVGFPYVDGLSCQWVLHGKPGTSVSLSFTHINTSKDLDFLAIYYNNGKGENTVSQVSNFSGIFSGSNLPRINLTGEVMIIFATQTDNGTGWSANFNISSPINRSKSSLLIVIIVSVTILIGFSLALITFAMFRQRKKLRNRRYKNEKLKLIRVEFNEVENRIGEGPHATVYRANSTDGTMVAVKSQREKTSKTDLEEEILIKASSHPNIICLMGYTQDGSGRRHLVFEFMSRGTLSLNLRERGETLSWEKRLTIALHVSSALQLLHMYSMPPIYHGNLEPENVLLDESYNAKLGGFRRANYCTNDVLNMDKPSEMAGDIWNFGLLLVDLLRGETLLNRSLSPEHFSKVAELLEVPEHLDSRLELPQDECKVMSLVKLGEIAKWCINSNWKFGGGDTSPKIGDVVLGLKQVMQLFCSV